MNQINHYFIIVAISFTALQSQAWFLFEPFIGYNKGQEQASTLQGIGIGARTGIEFKDLFIVVDFDYNDLQQGAISSAKYTDTGLTFGGTFQHTRFWYGMITSAQLSYPSGASTVTSKGSGSKFGIGTEINNKLNINFELRSINFTTTDPGTGASTPIAEIATIGFLTFSWLL
ncbi:MAG: hypothetical protein WA160_04885 [Pseudobdellovibrio sp.]